jgi:predicted nuclease of restriction endonuclease-like (RecB) superfamily
MNKDKKETLSNRSLDNSSEYNNFLTGITSLLERARHIVASSVNAIMTETYWEIGHRIVKYEQHGQLKAEYGQRVINRLSKDLSKRFGRGFGERNLFQMRAFYIAYPEKVQTVSAKFGEVSYRFPLPWSHYVAFLSLKSPQARAFYEKEALRNGWTARQLDRQINAQFFERIALSRNKVAMLTKCERKPQEDVITPEEEIKDPFVLEFLGLKDEYSESELEEALIKKLENFLLELGGDFAFVGRQHRLRIGDEWYRVDLLFYHRLLRCLVVIDLKLGKFTPSDAGQMHLYLNYAKEHWTREGENPPVGLILCTDRNEAVARYALEGLPNKVLAAEYRTALPDEKILIAELERSRKMLESKHYHRKKSKISQQGPG